MGFTTSHHCIRILPIRKLTQELCYIPLFVMLTFCYLPFSSWMLIWNFCYGSNLSEPLVLSSTRVFLSIVPWAYDPILTDSAASAPWILIAFYDNALVLLNRFMLPRVFAYHHSSPHRAGNLLHLDLIEQLFFRSTFARWNTWRCLTIIMTSWHRRFIPTLPMMTTSLPSPCTRSSTPTTSLDTMSKNCMNLSLTLSWSHGPYIFEFPNWFLR